MRSRIIGCGSYLPENIVTNDELAKRVDTSDEWITERTGIKQRHIAAPGQLTSDLAFRAAKAALESAKLTAKDIDLIILATTTPDRTFPSTATKVQALLGMEHGAAFDVQAVCAGFIYALSVADNFIRAGQAKHVLVIGAETLSRIVNWEDRTTCVLFGDGAGAVVLQAHNDPKQGILSTHLHSDGRFQDILFVDGGPSSENGAVGKINMLGQDVFKHAVDKMAKCVEQALETNNLTGNDIDFLVPHQANIRILDAVARRLKVNKEKVVTTVANHANTSAASIPLALDTIYKQNRLTKGDYVVLEAIGGGLAWGSCLLCW